MESYTLPPISKSSGIELLHFPTRLHAFVFRNWEFVPLKKLAVVLGTTEQNVKELAALMGLPEQSDISSWKTRGYITVIKQNWHLLPYSQLMQLLDITADELAYILKEDDFLSVKMGEKFNCPPLKYEPLNDDQLQQTKIIRDTVAELFKERKRKPFDFFTNETEIYPYSKKQNTVVADDNWGIKDTTGFERAGLFADRFRNDIENLWGTKLCGSKHFITLIKDVQAKPEAHTVTVTANTITVSASDEIGILRGLNRITDMAKQYGKAVIPLGTHSYTPRFSTRMIYSYHGLYGNVFDADPDLSFSDKMLKEYSALGINAVWVQGILYKLTEFPYDPSVSDGWQKRRENLQKIVKKAADYGIKVFLYLNEPRSLPTGILSKHPEMMGVTEDGFSAMCTSVPKTLNYLYKAVHDLCISVPGLGGFFTITMSENLTNCWSRAYNNGCKCKRCAGRTPAEVAAEVNNTINAAMKSADPKMKLMAWTWGWRTTKGFSDEECIKLLHDDISVLSCSEDDMPFEIAGVKGNVMDYTMSLPAPGQRSIDIWASARKHGKKTAAKIQINNTWECSTVPYIPVFGLVSQHIKRLIDVGVNDLLLSWTLGGAPSPNIKAASEYFFESNGVTESPLNSLYGKHAEAVQLATEHFDNAFREFPFSIQTVYFGPQFSGPANLMYFNPCEETATMTGFPYEDVNSWKGPYSSDILEVQFKKLSEKWKNGLDILLKEMDCSEIADIAEACYDIFRSSYNQIKYVRLKQQHAFDEIIGLLDEEQQLAESLYNITLRRPEVGYEAANHYVFTPGMCLEKVLNCKRLKQEFSLHNS